MQGAPTSPRPPVPPKDTPERYLHAPYSMADDSLSASKRKRQSRAFLDPDDLSQDEYTPKRSRPSPVSEQHDADHSPRRQGYLRRKKGVNNLSSVSLRHQALQQEQESMAQQVSTTRPSRFQEGSLTDKPSQKPPSTYMRDGDVTSLEQLDVLGPEYNALEFTFPENESLRQLPPYQGLRPVAQASPPASNGGILFRFGQKIASTFRTGAMWNKVWNETKEELTMKNLEAAERRKLQKEQAEAKYASMKRNGQAPTKRSSSAYMGGLSARDSGIEFDKKEIYQSHHSLQTSLEDFGPVQSQDTSVDGDGEGGWSTLRGRLHIKRPSLSNLRFDLKRARSELNIAQASKDSSLSLSPRKHDDEPGVLVKSQSRADLKKQQKLSKRVSDLEAKLQTAREELGEALAQASPMPKLGSKYERFTPSTARKSNFVPGVLPSLPSESLFDVGVKDTHDRAEMRQSGQNTCPSESTGMARSRTQRAIGEADGEDTIKASRPRTYPNMASSLFEAAQVQHMQDTEIEDLAAEAMEDSVPSMMHTGSVNPAALTKPTPDDSSHDEITTMEVTPVKHTANYDSPRTTSSKKARIKKRKAGHDDATYRPGKDEDDDSDPGKTAGKKRNSGPSTRMTIKKRQTGASITKHSVPAEDHQQDESDDAHFSLSIEEEDDDHDEHIRRSLDSSVHSLEPVYEEEEESVMVPINEAPQKPTATATPARFGRMSRSISPAKRLAPAQPGAEEVMITRAADAVKKHPSRTIVAQKRPKDDDFQWPEDVF